MKYLKEKIPNNWQIVTFRDVAELRHGYQFRNYDYTEDGIKIFKITQIKGDGIADISSCSYIDANRIEEFERVLLNKGDILIALTGATIGKVARFNFDEIVLQNYRVGNFFPLSKKVLNKEYFYQFLKSRLFYDQIIANQTQSAQQNIGKEDINNMSVLLPPIAEQKAISNILSAIDDKIENNLAIIKTLEDMAMALYKHWFVDFGPLQNGEFVDSELGPIPKGWEVKRLDDLANILNSKRVPLCTRERSNRKGEYPYYGASGIIDFIDDYIFDGEYVIISEDGENLRSRKTPIAFRAIGKFWVNNHAHILQEKKRGINKILISHIAQLEMNPFLTGAVQPKLNKQNLLSIGIPFPEDNSVITRLLDKFYSFSRKEISIELENQILIKLRDTLLPKLISGEVRLKEFKEQVEQIV